MSMSSGEHLKEFLCAHNSSVSLRKIMIISFYVCLEISGFYHMNEGLAYPSASRPEVKLLFPGTLKSD